MNDDKALTQMELDKLCVVFSRMSPSAKNSFISMMITKFPNKYMQLVDALGEDFEDYIAKA